MEVAITVTDAVESATSVAFAKMLTASFEYRKIESETFVSTQPQAILNLASKEAAGSDYIKKLSENTDELQFHIDIQTFSLESPTVSTNFIIPQTPYVIDQEIASAVSESLKIFSNTMTLDMNYNNMYPSTYAKLVLRVPTITIMINEGSVDLYRAAADEIVEFVENYG